jgi:hypothetical protein
LVPVRDRVTRRVVRIVSVVGVIGQRASEPEPSALGPQNGRERRGARTIHPGDRRLPRRAPGWTMRPRGRSQVRRSPDGQPFPTSHLVQARPRSGRRRMPRDCRSRLGLGSLDGAGDRNPPLYRLKRAIDSERAVADDADDAEPRRAGKAGRDRIELGKNRLLSWNSPTFARKPLWARRMKVRAFGESRRSNSSAWGPPHRPSPYQTRSAEMAIMDPQTCLPRSLRDFIIASFRPSSTIGPTLGVFAPISSSGDSRRHRSNPSPWPGCGNPGNPYESPSRWSWSGCQHRTKTSPTLRPNACFPEIGRRCLSP